MISNMTNFFDFYQEIGATARAKNEALTARAMFVTGVMEQSYRLWMTLLTTEVSEAVQAAHEISACKTPIEVAEVQRAWLHAASARAITSLQGTIEISNFLIRNVQDTLAATAPAPTQPSAPPQPARPPAAVTLSIAAPTVAEAAPVIKAAAAVPDVAATAAPATVAATVVAAAPPEEIKPAKPPARAAKAPKR